MTNLNQITVWHAAKPMWALKLTAKDWDTAELIAAELDTLAEPERVGCDLAPAERYCTLLAGHTEPCRTFRLDGDD